MKKSIAGLLFSVALVSNAEASIIEVDFNNGDSLADWTVDRSAPDGFEIVNNELHMTVAGQLNGNNFYNTQGMQLDIGHSKFLSIDLYIDSSMAANDGRYGGLWGVGRDNSDNITAYPILEAQTDAGTIVTDVYDSNIGWAFDTASLVLDAFNTFSIEITSNGTEYGINGTTVYTDLVSDVSYIGSVILNGYNTLSAQGGYTARFDNLRYVDVPEPGMLSIFMLGFAGLMARRYKKA
ncbi:PEP-CTERM sorting domain-containing protein [Psychrosphaera sp. 1_MG-2023]|uniref:PEP-CTERM sorting domain-containing protein n=1 Tax=Psychrosphaera sp. 1_MG-2023 TaxID=3062643 RepID=UPI0026E16A3B|nr:PEP-CTERM sorting domain-containing protein [Psychrosphaera sp. 1_MG-2023]MDO6720674.1 PEP-CTERM sorting domain-containing protein [Psychrosphaera sp. 1_MG-2023]